MKRLFLPMTVLGFCLIGVIGWMVSSRAPVSGAIQPSPQTATPSTRAPYNPQLTQQTVEFWAAHVRRDPHSAIAFGHLSAAYLQRSQETGDVDDVRRAEQAARKSLRLLPHYNSRASYHLAKSLLHQHRFPEALAVVNGIARQDPSAHRLRADLYIELGDYRAAERALALIPRLKVDPGYHALSARLLEIKGQPEQALRLLQQAQREADSSDDMPAENVAWFHERVGHRLAAMGRITEAAQAYQQALKIFPSDYRALASLARLAADRGDWKATIEWGQKAAEIVPAPETVALIGDAYIALGNRAAAREQYQLVEVMAKLARAHGAIYDRQRALFYADHNRHLDEALSLARGELKLRKDIYAYDTLAWVCYKKGLLKEAQAAMNHALAQGTQDASLFYHAGMIAHARGDRAHARTYLQRALATNPYFHPFAPRIARSLLAKL